MKKDVKATIEHWPSLPIVTISSRRKSFRFLEEGLIRHIRLPIDVEANWIETTPYIGNADNDSESEEYNDYDYTDIGKLEYSIRPAEKNKDYDLVDNYDIECEYYRADIELPSLTTPMWEYESFWIAEEDIPASYFFPNNCVDFIADIWADFILKQAKDETYVSDIEVINRVISYKVNEYGAFLQKRYDESLSARQSQQ